MRESKEALRLRLEALGFDDVRFASLAPRLRGTGLVSWLASGGHADMAWMERTAAKRLDPGLVLPGARSAILLGVNYLDDERTIEGNRPVWARYALYRDYHDTVKPALARAGSVLEELCGFAPSDYRYYVDTGPVLERAWAARAGLGFIGKNSMLISRRHGNWLFLACILTRGEFEPDPPVRRRPGDAGEIGLLCGKCTRCLDACPTRAFDGPGVVNAGRCISYQTIENKGIIPRALRVAIGTRVYGCDVCLDVCPWNRFARRGRRMILSTRRDIGEVSLRDLLDLTPARYAALFRGTAIKRIKLTGLLRNACIAAGNSGDPSLIPSLVKLASHASSTVRVHAVWAVYRLRAGAQLSRTRAAESDPSVLSEYTESEAEAVV